METQNTDLIEKLVMEGQQNEGEEYEDHYDNLTKTTPYSGKKKLRALYEDGCFIGDIEYYNGNICK